ncbi:MAG: cytochrome c family protein [Parvibaculaceae bacterium]|nr:cytochrome c family protein [Parvibaculaceae bacterium]HBM90146.1 cytochrome c family protein [Rhodobiaceae bacterium]
MDSFEFNKIAGAFLFSILLLMGVRELTSVMFSPEAANPASYPVEVADSGAPAGGDAGPVADEGPSLATLLASADIGKGEKVAKKCAACHTFDEGGANKVGPNLYGVVGRPVAQAAGFNFSGALQGLGGEWTFDRLDGYLEKPRDYAPGNTMSFAGLRKPNDRANIIAYLNAQGSNVPLPAAE